MSSSTANPPPLIGKRIAKRYEPRSLIGRGGMGAVYRAVDTRSGRDVALKLIRPEFSSDPKTRRRFNKEARAFAYLKHPHIVEVFDFGQDDDGTLYLAMELVAGTSLRALRKARLPLSGILSIVDQLLGALAHAHARGVIHRDLKPENVLVAQDADSLEPIVKLVDFGLASLPTLATAGGTQHTGTVIGTPSYMAPEQARGSRGVVGPGTDIYAIGVMLYELLCDRLPYEAEGGIELILKHVQQPIPPLRPRDDLELPPELAKAVHRAMAKKPWDRYVNAADFRRALQKIDVPHESMPRIVRRSSAAAAELGDEAQPGDVFADPDDMALDAGAPQREHETAVVRQLDEAPAVVGATATAVPAGTDTPSPPAAPPSSPPAGTARVQTRSGTRWQFVSDEFAAVESEQLPTPPVGETYISSLTFSMGNSDMVGRELELERVRVACERALSGQGQVIVVEGEAGIGKTRLARTVVHRFTETGLMRAAVGLYTGTEGGGTNVGLRGALESIFGTTDMDRSAMASQTRGVLERLGVHDAHDIAELIEYLRGAEDIRSEPDLVDGAMRRQRSRLALIQRTVRLIAQEMPLLLLLEDIHWASDGIAGFLESMASSFRLHATPCAVICTVTSDEIGQGSIVGDGLGNLARFDGVHRINLGRLCEENILALITSTLPLESGLARHLAMRAGGNPFYAQHFLQALRQDNRLVRDDKRKKWRLRDDVALESALPASVGDVLRGRIQRTRARLGDDKSERYYEILTLCAVLGMATDDELLEAFVTAVDPALDADLDDALDLWIKSGVLREATERQADVLEFDHGLMRDVILEDLPGRKLRRLHRVAAITKRDHYYPFLQGVAHDIAEHHRLAGDPELSAEYRLLAARAAESAGNFAEAEGHFRQLLALYRERTASLGAEDSGMIARHNKSGLLRITIDWSEVWLGLGRIAIARGDYDKATEHVEELSRYAEERTLMLPMAKSNWLLGRISTRRGQLVEAWDRFGTARDLFEAEEDMLGVAQCLWGIGQVAQLSGWLNEARAWLEEARSIYESAERPIDVASCLLAMGSTALAGGLLDEAHTHYELAQATFEGAQDRYNVNYCLLGLARVASERGNSDDSLDLLEQALGAFVQLGDRHGQIDCINRLGQCYLATGRLDLAQQHLSEALSGYQALDDRHGQGHNLRLQAQLKRLRGAATEAVQFLGQALDHLQEAGDRQGQAACDLEMARIAIDLEDLERAEVHFNEAHELYTISSDAIGIASCAELYATICARRGRLDDALGAAQEGLGTAEKTGARPLVARLIAAAMAAAAATSQFADLRRLAHALDELGLALDTIGEPAFERALADTAQALQGAGVDPDLRGFRNRLENVLGELRARWGR